LSDEIRSTPEQREARRLAALDRYGVMDTAREADFDDIVKVAAQICGTSMALISLVDDRRQWFKAALGLDAPETPREVAFCAHAIQQEGVFLVENAAIDPRFEHNPLVTGDPNLRFYAGAPLQTPDGFALGTLCVLDSKPGVLSPEQAFALKALSRQVIIQLELRRALAEARELQAHRELLTLELQHRVKNTLATVQAIVSQTLRNAGTDPALRISISDRLVTLGKAHDLLTASTWLGAPLAEVIETALAGGGVERGRFDLDGPPVDLPSRTALGLALALHELSTNAIKYGAFVGEAGRVALTWSVSEGVLRFEWRERGGPPVAPPTRTGFGARLIARALPADLGGTSVLDYAPTGLVFTLEAPL
jgi:two-component sensor histidine kinase